MNSSRGRTSAGSPDDPQAREDLARLKALLGRSPAP